MAHHLTDSRQAQEFAIFITVTDDLQRLLGYAKDRHQLRLTARFQTHFTAVVTNQAFYH